MIFDDGTLHLDAREPMPPVIGGPYWDALLDDLDAREQAITDHVETMLPVFTPRLARIVAVAARPRVTEDTLTEAALPLDRVHRMTLAHLVDLAGDWHDTHHARRREARAVDPAWASYPPVRREHIEARRAARLVARQDDASTPIVEKVSARLIQGGRVPELARLGTMTDAELNLLLRRFGIAKDRERMLSREVSRATRRLVGADNPDRALVDRVLDDAERAVRRTLRQSTKVAVREYRATAAGWQPDTVLRWETSGGKSCPSCEDRHGLTATWAAWQARGEPGSSNLFCGLECNCGLTEV